MILQPGTPAPAFTLHCTPDQTVSLTDFRGQPVILAFYPADWSPGLRRPDGALQRDPAASSASTTRRCSASRSTAPGATLRLRRTASCTFRCWPTSSPRARWRGATAPIATPGRRLRAGALRDRRRRHHPLELRLADRREPRRRRHPRGARGAAAADRPRDRGSHGHGQSRVSRLCCRRASAITSRDRRRHRSRWSSTATTSARTAARAYPIVKRVQRALGEQLRFVFRNFPLAEMHPHAARAAEAAEAAGGAGKVLGDARHALREPAAHSTTRTSCATRGRSGSTCRASSSELADAPGKPECARTS